MSAAQIHRIEHPAAWSVKSLMAQRDQWIYQLTEDDLAELDTALQQIKTRGLESIVPATGSGRFAAEANPDLRVDFAAVCYGEHRPLLIDSRDPPRFSGEVEPIDPQAGHIPGAINLPWRAALGDNGLLRSAAETRQCWQALFEGKPAPILYCGSGVTACVNLLALEVAGLQGARLYPGSWSDWCQHGGAVATGLN